MEEDKCLFTSSLLSYYALFQFFAHPVTKQLDESKVVWRAGKEEEKFMVDYGSLGLGFSQCLVFV